MKSDASEVEFRLIGDIYDAALATELWPQVLQEIVTLSGSNSAIITALDKLNPNYTFAFTHNIPDEPLRVYREAGLDAADMELNAGPMICTGVGSTLLSTTAYGTQEEYIRRAGEFYERCLKPSNIYYLAGTLLDHGEFRAGLLGIHRPESWAPLTRVQTDLLARLCPHIRRALQIHRQLTSANRRNAQLYQLLDSLATGVLLLNAHGHLRYANARAEALLAQHGALRITVREGVQAARAEQDLELQELIRSAIATGRRELGPNGAGGVIALRTEKAGTPLMLTVTPLSELAGYRELASDEVAAAIFLSDPHGRHVLSRPLLKASYRLTERECDLCEAFANNATLEGAAAACGLALASVRTNMKSIYEKTGQHSQAELMRLLMGMTLDFEHIR
jgi:PAS domain-containing protein/DNA-binding CsgD family transcriptional regulator